MHLDTTQRGVSPFHGWFVLVALATACADDTTTPAGGDVSSEQPVVASRAPRVKYKSGPRYANDLSVALEVPREVLCRELGRYDCVDQVHRIVLGGVEPYTLGVREPLASIPVTAPIAQDRVALSACTERVGRDLASPQSLILAGVDAAAPTQAQLESTSARLYDRILRRDADPAELNALVEFYGTVVKEHGAAGPEATRDWAILSCFMVATTLESIFY